MINSIMPLHKIRMDACEDGGVGISSENKKLLFTQRIRKQTGIRWSLSWEILPVTRITITETGTPGKGACFEIPVPKGMWRITGGRMV
jgi:hypothetical protein